MEKVTVPQSELEYEIVIHHNVLTKTFTVDGVGRNFLLEIGMLEYAIQQMKRADMQSQLARQMAEGPRIVRPGIPPS